MTDINRAKAIRLAAARELDLKKTFECGQCFRWDEIGPGMYSGVVSCRAAVVWTEGEAVYAAAPESEKAFWHDYFDLGVDYREADRLLESFGFMRPCVEYGAGIRILNQEFWETLCSFIISQCNNIPRIKKIIRALCRNFGEPVYRGGEALYGFPSVETVARLSLEDLGVLKCGYRADYILKAARAVSEGDLDIKAISRTGAEGAVSELRKLRGVGEKVANCVALFGLGKGDAFPVDVWMKRAAENFFPPGFDPKSFGRHAGLAQQYIYHYTRTAQTEEE